MVHAFLTLLVAVWLERGGAHPWPEKSSLYQDCEIFNKTHLYGGPVCGSDVVSYANSLFLDCVNYHNVQNVAILHLGGCRRDAEYCKPNLYYEPVCGSDNISYTNLESLVCASRGDYYSRRTPVKVASHGPCRRYDYCSRYGLESNGINPVCGNNGLTYQNAAQAKCLQTRNPSLKILHDGGCRPREVLGLYGREEKACEIADSRYEWNPVCASNGLTYPNPFLLLCYEPDLRIVWHGACGTESQHSCGLIAQPEGEGRPAVSGAEVCGSDGVSYRTVHHLRCESRYNKYLFVKHSGPCSGPEDDPCGSIPEENHRHPVCGSDGSSYVSPEALWCANRRFPGKNLSLVHDGPCSTGESVPEARDSKKTRAVY